MHKKFSHADIEKKWQNTWKETGLYNIGERDSSKEKKYILVEWPYPSGNLHIGHWFAFAVVDMYVRALRMQGKQVLFPIGFDAFGLPAENAAIKHKLNPKERTESNVAYMKNQLESMGNGFSWNMTTSSTNPDYYRWTQWMFTKFFEKGIAYCGTGVVNWCPGCNTVIANEQVLSDGTCERSGDAIEKREMPQWMLKITDYADRLIDDLETLPWPEHIKEAQRRWIGRSTGAEIDFLLNFKKDPRANDNRDPHGERAQLSIFTTRPDTLFGATYLVLAPEHLWVTLALRKDHDVLENKNEVQAYVEAAKEKSEIDRTNDTREKTGVELKGVVAINPATGGEIPMFVGDYVLSGYGTGAIMGVPAHDERDFMFAENFRLKIIQVIKSETTPYTGNGEMVNSAEFDGMKSEDAKEHITKKVGGKMTNTYRLRDWSIGRQRYWGVPIPIVYDPEGNAHPIPEEHLPWLLPTDVDFTPTGEPPLAKSAELRERTERIFGKGWTPETETMDTFVDSSWYFLRYCDNKNPESFASIEKQKKWMPVDVYFGGSEHTTMHLLYSRFWQKALFDLGLVTVSEPYTQRINRGLVIGPDGNKMSKSKGNVIDPDEQVRKLGADTVKMYLAFTGPYGEPTNYPWDMGGIVGLRRFLERVFGLSAHITADKQDETTKLLHKTIEKVTHDIALYKFNTAISALMIFINHAEKNGLTQDTYLTFLKLLAPFAPHLTEELWHDAGNTTSIHTESWPRAQTQYLSDEVATISVQINGKMRGTVIAPIDASEETVVDLIYNDATLKSKLPAPHKKVFFVKNKIINLIT